MRWLIEKVIVPLVGVVLAAWATYYFATGDNLATEVLPAELSAPAGDAAGSNESGADFRMNDISRRR